MGGGERRAGYLAEEYLQNGQITREAMDRIFDGPTPPAGRRKVHRSCSRLRSKGMRYLSLFAPLTPSARFPIWVKVFWYLLKTSAVHQKWSRKSQSSLCPHSDGPVNGATRQSWSTEFPGELSWIPQTGRNHAHRYCIAASWLSTGQAPHDKSFPLWYSQSVHSAGVSP